MSSHPVPLLLRTLKFPPSLTPAAFLYVLLFAACLTQSCQAAAFKSPVPCYPLKEFDNRDWKAIASAFEGATELQFGQHWKPAPEKAFRPARVRIGWRGDRLLFFAELQDDHIHTVAKSRNEEFFKTSDVFELFAGIPGAEAYIEYHVSPNNILFQLGIPSLAMLKSTFSKNLRPIMIRDNNALNRSKVENGRWLVYGELPASSLPGAKLPLKGRVWQISFCRYDYSARGKSYVLSSTSRHKKPSYHRRHEWRPVRFLEAAR